MATQAPKRARTETPGVDAEPVVAVAVVGGVVEAEERKGVDSDDDEVDEEEEQRRMQRDAIVSLRVILYRFARACNPPLSMYDLRDYNIQALKTQIEGPWLDVCRAQGLRVPMVTTKFLRAALDDLAPLGHCGLCNKAIEGRVVRCSQPCGPRKVACDVSACIDCVTESCVRHPQKGICPGCRQPVDVGFKDVFPAYTPRP